MSCLEVSTKYKKESIEIISVLQKFQTVNGSHSCCKFGCLADHKNKFLPFHRFKEGIIKLNSEMFTQ